MNAARMLVPILASIALYAVITQFAIAAQDRNTVRVPGGIAFAEFEGYEKWEFISLSRNDKLVAVIVGNPVIIEAYKAGIPDNGRPFPDGAKMAKIHWIPKQSPLAPGPATVAGTLHDVDFMLKDSKRFADSGGWGYGAFKYSEVSDTFTPFHRGGRTATVK